MIEIIFFTSEYFFFSVEILIEFFLHFFCDGINFSVWVKRQNHEITIFFPHTKGNTALKSENRHYVLIWRKNSIYIIEDKSSVFRHKNYGYSCIIQSKNESQLLFKTVIFILLLVLKWVYIFHLHSRELSAWSGL